jgi:hypothetical protein
LVAGPLATHVYWMLGGTWGVPAETAGSAGIRAVAALVLVLLTAAILVVLARAGLWQQQLVPDWMISVAAWALAAVFALETLAAFTWSRGTAQWLLYGPSSLVIALLAVIVAAAGTTRPRVSHWRRPEPLR